jgi:hypothetical protein
MASSILEEPGCDTNLPQNWLEVLSKVMVLLVPHR